MKYSILGFSQEMANKLQKEIDGKVKKLDITDLLILRDIADFMNRSRIIKYTIDDKVYFSIQYSTILEDLPILDIKQQALSDRLDKLVSLDILEKIVVKNQSGTFVAFRMGKDYEKLIYEPTSSEVQVQKYPTTTHNTNITNNNKEEIDKSISKKDVFFNMFEAFVIEYKKLYGKHTGGGAKTLFNEFTKRHKDWRDVIPLLMDALHKEDAQRNKAKQSNEFFPSPKLLSTYLGKQRAWEAWSEEEATLFDEKNTIDNSQIIIDGQLYR